MRRPISADRNNLSRISPINPDIEPAPRPWPFAPAIALLAVLGFLSLQFLLPATHYRDPWDPHRNWIPFDKKPAAEPKVDVDLNPTHLAVDREKLNSMHVFCWTDEADLRPLAVVINSTISNAIFPENISFHFVVPKTLSTVGFFRLKSFFPLVNLDMVNDDSFIEKMQELMTFWRGNENGKPILNVLDFLPFYVPKVYPDIARFVYLDSSIVLQGRIEDLFQMDMQGYAVAAVEDCSYHFSDLFDSKLLEIVRESRESGKPSMPDHPFSSKTCSFDQAVLVVDTKRWIEQNLTEAIEWWTEESRKRHQSLYRYGLSEPPVLLALYQNYQKLDAFWNVREPHVFHSSSAAKIIHFNKDRRPWHMERLNGSQDSFAGLWWSHLSTLANEMLKPGHL